MGTREMAESQALASGVVLGADGLARCAWPGIEDPTYEAYHDHEWGEVVHGERELFERICLEAFQSGLSWLTILRKRPAFRAAFADFDPEVVAAYDAHAVERLMQDASIVRNRRKIEATIANAQATLALRERGGLDRLVWSHQPSEQHEPQTMADMPAQTPESVALARALKAAGMRHVGPTTMYAAMQACGLVDDHLPGCHRART